MHERKPIIADASCLIVLDNIGKLDLLRDLFGEILITAEVKDEFRLELPVWIKIQEIENRTRFEALNLILDKGEAGSIALALEISGNTLIIDEKKGRNIARELGLKIIGTLGLILIAKQRKLIASPEDILTDMENAGFYISPKLKSMLLE